MDALIGIALLWFAAAVVPGPDVLAIARTSVGVGRLAGMASVAGVALGTVIWGATGFFGISALFAVAPWLYVSLKVAGATYLCYVGLTMVRASFAGRDNEAQLEPEFQTSLFRAFVQGLAANLSNPKTAVFVASIFATMLPAHPSLALGLGTIGVTTMVSIAWYTVVALVLSTQRARSAFLEAKRAIMAGAGVLFIGFGLQLAFRK